MDEKTDTQPIKRRRGRQPKMRPGFNKPKEHDTPTIKEGASWYVGQGMEPHIDEEQDELKRRHNEAMEKKANVERAIELSREIEKVIEPDFAPNSVIQIRTETKMGELALVGEAEGHLLHCYAFSPDGPVFFTIRKSECVLISPVKKGMRVIKYEKPEQSITPQEDRPM